MKGSSTLLVIIAMVAAQLAPTAILAQGAPGAIGVAAAIKNVVQMQIIKDRGMRPAILREPVHIGDTVASGPNSALQVLLRDQTVFTIGANARMTIDRFVYDSSRSSGAVAASVARGAFRFMSGRAAHNGGVAIQTPVASIGVRGTIVEVLVGDEAVSLINSNPGLSSQAAGMDPMTATLIVLRGPGPERVGQDRIGEIEITANGKTTVVSNSGVVVVKGPNSDPSQTFPLTPEIAERLDASLSTAPMSQEQRVMAAQIATSLAAALAASPAETIAALPRIASDFQANPVALQAALARAGGSLPSDSAQFLTLMQLSFLVMAATNAPSVGILGEQIGSDRGRTLVESFANGTLLSETAPASARSPFGDLFSTALLAAQLRSALLQAVTLLGPNATSAQIRAAIRRVIAQALLNGMSVADIIAVLNGLPTSFFGDSANAAAALAGIKADVTAFVSEAQSQADPRSDNVPPGGDNDNNNIVGGPGPGNTTIGSDYRPPE